MEILTLAIAIDFLGLAIALALWLWANRYENSPILLNMVDFSRKVQNNCPKGHISQRRR
jgi:hypothetical protein